ncbi:MAG: 50S ribosomal protein L35 [Candidatus Paceibacterota bacterium]
MKTNKSYTKRLKVSKNGKITARKAGQNHFNAKESSQTKGVKKQSQSIQMSTRDRRRFLPSA